MKTSTDSKQLKELFCRLNVCGWNSEGASCVYSSLHNAVECRLLSRLSLPFRSYVLRIFKELSLRSVSLSLNASRHQRSTLQNWHSLLQIFKSSHVTWNTRQHKYKFKWLLYTCLACFDFSRSPEALLSLSFSPDLANIKQSSISPTAVINKMDSRNCW